MQNTRFLFDITFYVDINDKLTINNEEITFKNTYNDSSTGIISIITPYLLLIIVSIILIGSYSFVSNKIKA